MSAISPENRSNGNNFPELNAKSAKSNETTLKQRRQRIWVSFWTLLLKRLQSTPLLEKFLQMGNIIWFLDVRKMTTCACLLRHLHLVSIWPCAICALSEIVRFCQKNIFVEKSVASYLKWATSVQIRSRGFFSQQIFTLQPLSWRRRRDKSNVGIYWKTFPWSQVPHKSNSRQFGELFPWGCYWTQVTKRN